MNLPRPPSEDPAPPTPIDAGSARFEFAWRQHWPWLLVLLALLALTWLLTPILAPFVIGGVLAYLGDPLADRLQRHGLSRTFSVSVLFLVFFGALIALMVIVIPLLEKQVIIFLGVIPDWLRWLQDIGLPRLGVSLPEGARLDPDSLAKTLTAHWGQAGDLAKKVLGMLTHSTPTVLGVIADALMVPLVAFYLLRDWDRLVEWIADLVPRPLLPRVAAFGRETDAVLSSLIRGQLAVMAALALIYSLGLWIAGLDIALLIGCAAGMVSFIPYLGFISGLIAASIAMLVQTQSLLSLLGVGIVFGIGQILESGVLTPTLVGDRIGLHPVAVIFAVLAGGQLFGFVGVLLALPVAAVLAVMARHTRERWLSSPVYRGRSGPPAM